ncbi:MULTISPECIES: universal stress protein [unclassified Luteimonas]|uniref:universal stress protein n=1 Tax=Lysobacteraceae TaxID=32033 RepID=UPI00100A3C90|nr:MULTISPECIES: universal stress protein [unclassified Luteimonas]MCD9046959.1 universal stress protein [Luteimonas sp. MHLX1A]
MKIVVAVDGSEISQRAVKFAIKLARGNEKSQITLVAVNPELFPGVERKIGAEAAARHHAESHASMIDAAVKTLTRAKVDFRERREVGDIATTIVEVARKARADLIVMGARGRGAVSGMLLGSVSGKVLAQADVPVTIVR